MGSNLETPGSERKKSARDRPEDAYGFMAVVLLNETAVPSKEPAFICR